jgi:hypothetical protein
LLTCDATMSGGYVATFRRNKLHSYSGWKTASTLNKTGRVQPKRRKDILYSYSGWKTVSTLKKRKLNRNVGRTFYIHIQGGRPCPPLRKGRKLNRNVGSTFCIHIQGDRPCPPLRKGSQVQPKRRHISTTHVASHPIMRYSKSPHIFTNSTKYVTYFQSSIKTKTGLTVTNKEFAQIVRHISATHANIFLRSRATLVCLYRGMSSAQ